MPTDIGIIMRPTDVSTDRFRWPRRVFFCVASVAFLLCMVGFARSYSTWDAATFHCMRLIPGSRGDARSVQSQHFSLCSKNGGLIFEIYTGEPWKLESNEVLEPVRDLTFESEAPSPPGRWKIGEPQNVFYESITEWRTHWAGLYSWGSLAYTIRVIEVPYAVFAGALLLLGMIAAWRSNVWRRRIGRTRANQCLTCGYDLRALPKAAPCPECGSLAGESKSCPERSR